MAVKKKSKSAAKKPRKRHGPSPLQKEKAPTLSVPNWPSLVGVKVLPELSNREIHAPPALRVGKPPRRPPPQGGR
jgi:hypothetical protein